MNLKLFLFSFFFLLFIEEGFSQTSIVIKRQNAVIFNNDLKISFFQKYEKRIALNKEDIEKSEIILEKKYQSFKRAKYKRQYVGYINELSQIIVFVNLIDCKMKNKYHKDWKKDLIIGFGDLYDKYTSSHYINIITEKID